MLQLGGENAQRVWTAWPGARTQLGNIEETEIMGEEERLILQYKSLLLG